MIDEKEAGQTSLNRGKCCSLFLLQKAELIYRSGCRMGKNDGASGSEQGEVEEII